MTKYKTCPNCNHEYQLWEQHTRCPRCLITRVGTGSTCMACEGSGKTSKGENCGPCCGLGIQSAYNDLGKE